MQSTAYTNQPTNTILGVPLAVIFPELDFSCAFFSSHFQTNEMENESKRLYRIG